jgi:hypothetical protein
MKMYARFAHSESPGKSRGVRNEDIWHSVWKRIEGSSHDDTRPAKKKMSLEPPRDYVVDRDNRSSARRA